MGSRADPIEGIDVILTKPDGSTETQTTEKDGQSAFTVTEPGNDLGPASTRRPCRTARPGPGEPRAAWPRRDHQGRQRGGRQAAARSTRSRPPASTTDEQTGQVPQSSVNGIRLGLLLALASVGSRLIYGTTGLSNFAHAEQVTLGGMLGYGLVNLARASPAGSAACWP